MENLINEMKKNSGVSLDETAVSVVKMMNAESRLIGAFGNLLRELQWIKRDSDSQPMNRHHGYNGPCSPPHEGPSDEDIERMKTVDKAKLYRIAIEKLEVVKSEIAKTFEEDHDEEDDDVKIVKIIKTDDDDDEEENESTDLDNLLKDFSLKKEK
jgi:hypothetical protein